MCYPSSLRVGSVLCPLLRFVVSSDIPLGLQVDHDDAAFYDTLMQALSDAAEYAYVTGRPRCARIVAVAPG